MSNFTSLLIHICSIQAKSLVTSGYEKTLTWADIAYLVPCRKDANTTGGPTDSAQLRTNVDDDIFFFNPDVTITRGNRIVFENENYDVIKVNKCYDSVGLHHIEVIARLIDHD